MGRSRGRGRGGRGRGAGGTTSTRGKGRPKKMVIESDEDEEEVIETSEIVDNQVLEIDEGMITDDADRENVRITDDKKPQGQGDFLGSEGDKVVAEFTLDDDISQLVPPTFSTVARGPPQPMLELRWDHKYTPIGDKLPTPNIHMCVGCRLPIRIYGRLIPCKHVYCHSCALAQSVCSSCSDRVTRVEQVALGQVFMCNHGGGARYGFEGCRRTYLSQRDLQAHFDHRHKPRTGSSTTPSSQASTPSSQNQPFDYNRQGSRGNIPASSGAQGQGSTPASRYERKSSFNRNNNSNSGGNSNWSNYGSSNRH